MNSSDAVNSSLNEPYAVFPPPRGDVPSAGSKDSMPAELLNAHQRLRDLVGSTGHHIDLQNQAAVLHQAANILQVFLGRVQEEAKPEFGLPIEQESKYTTDGYFIINRATGKPIPHDEVVCVFRAQDPYLLATLAYYAAHISDPAHQVAIERLINRVQAWQRANPHRVKQEPDTCLD